MIRGLFKPLFWVLLHPMLTLVILDGTKIKADASLAANRSYEWLKAQVRRMLEEAGEKDAEEDDLYFPERRGDELPASPA